MEKYQIGLLITVLLGLFILIGAGISLLITKKEKIIEFSIGLAFGVILALIFTDLLPEIFENLRLKYTYVAVIGIILGYLILKGLDSFIPDHHDDKMNKKEAKENLTHIGIITTIALVLHNIIEGMAVYSSTLSSVSMGIALGIGVGFHNLPLGMIITNSLTSEKKNIKKTIFLVLLVALSTFIGGLIMLIFNLTTINSKILGALLSITLGMLLFILMDELIPRITNTKNKKTIIIGIIFGILLLSISLFY
jgi:ZIP family zinc transporter